MAWPATTPSTTPTSAQPGRAACCVLFLKVNGVELDVLAAIVVERMPLLAAGRLNEASFAAWLRDCRRT